MGQTRKAYRILVGKYLGKWSFGRPRGRMKENVKVILTEIGCDEERLMKLVEVHIHW
jgi:hypothetical protein